MNSIFSLYSHPREAGRLAGGAILEYLIKGWGVAGAANIVIGSGETFAQMAVVKTGSESLVQTYVFLQQVDYKRIHSALNNIADNLQADEIRMTLGIALAALGFAYVFGSVVGARTTRGVPRLLSRFRQDWGAKRFPKWYKKNIRRVLGDNLYKAARESVEEDLRIQGRLRD